MGVKVKEYSNDEITILWKPDLCIHSSHCWKELGSVFKPKSRPWIDLDGAENKEIIEQVKRCPSGALTFKYNNQHQKENNMSQTENKVKVELLPNGPMILHGNCEVVNSDGSTEEKSSKTAFCRCGASTNKPYCDGSHSKAGFTG